MEEIGKLIHELFDDLRTKNETLEDRCQRLNEENNKMALALAKVTDLVSSLVTKSTTGDWYMQSLWGREFDGLIDLLGIELKEEEEE